MPRIEMASKRGPDTAGINQCSVLRDRRQPTCVILPYNEERPISRPIFPVLLPTSEASGQTPTARCCLTGSLRVTTPLVIHPSIHRTKRYLALPYLTLPTS